MIPILSRPIRRFIISNRNANYRLITCFSTSSSNTEDLAKDVGNKSAGTRAFFQFQDDTSENHTLNSRPEPPKDFAKEYMRRPMYGFAFKGNMVYKQINWWIIKVVLVSFVLNGVIFGGYYYHHYYIRDEKERKRLAESSVWAKKQNPEVQKYRLEIQPLMGSSDLARWAWFPEEGKMKKGEVYGVDQEAIWGDNKNDIVDQVQIMKRAETGRKDLHKTLAEFDAELK